MLHLSHWLPLFWWLLLPALSFAAALDQHRNYRRALRRGLVSAAGYGRLSVALAASQVFVLFLLASNPYDSAAWPAVGAVFSAVVMLAAARRAAADTHAGLRGFLRPLPRDGLQQIEWETASNRGQRRAGWAVRRIIPFLPPILVCAYVLSHLTDRWPGLWLVAPAFLGPMSIVPLRRYWLAPVVLLPLAVATGWHSLQLRDSLSPGRWTTPITGAACSGQVQLTLDREHAWCVDGLTGSVYRFRPRSGLIDLEVRVDQAFQMLAVDASQAWILQRPLRGLIHFVGGRQVEVKLNFASQGAVDRAGRLWTVDSSGKLQVIDSAGRLQRLMAADGLLSNTANVVKVGPDGSVWIGSVGGVSYLPAEEVRSLPTLPDDGSRRTPVGWRRVRRHDGLPGTVQNIAFGPDGSIWFVWTVFTGSRARWGLSAWKGGEWQVFELRPATGLDSPVSPDSLAIDSLGRAWFTAVSYAQEENFLGLLAPATGEVSLYALGHFATLSTIAYPGPHGVVSDGSGGIYVYSPGNAPFRHWRP